MYWATFSGKNGPIIKEEQKTQTDTKKTQIEEKLVSAANRREEVIEQVKQTAAQSIVLKKPSPAKEEQDQ